MPELSRPLIVIIGVVISVAILFLAIAGFLPFFAGTVGTVTKTASFSATGTGTCIQTDSNTYSVFLTINVQKLVGTGTYTVEIAGLYNPMGTNQTFTSMTGNTTISDTSTGFTIMIEGLDINKAKGDWTVVLNIEQDGSVVQTITLKIKVV